MHLVIDAVGNTGGGGLSVLKGLIKVLSAENDLREISIFLSPGVQCPEMGLRHIHAIEAPGPHGSYFKRVFWYLSTLPNETSQLGGDVLLCMNGMGIGPGGIPTFNLVQQSLPFCPEALGEFSVASRIKFKLIKKLTLYSLRRSDCIIVQAPWMRGYLVKTQNIGKPVEIISPETVELNLPEPDTFSEDLRLLYVGSASPHKNLGPLIKGFIQLKNRLPNIQLCLTIDPIPKYSVPGVVFLGHLPRSALFEQYKKATLLVMPSLVETVGLPLLEALSVGTPVIASDRPFAHDVCGDAAHYFNPRSPDSIAELAFNILANPAVLQTLRKNVDPRYRELKLRPSYESLVPLILERLVGDVSQGSASD